MTVQEAIERLDKKLCHEKEPHKFCRDACMYGEDCCEVQVAKMCMEKQIPKKPIKDDTSYSGYKCPTCNSNVYQLRSHNIMQTPHCIFCGQALKWGEEE